MLATDLIRHGKGHKESQSESPSSSPTSSHHHSTSPKRTHHHEQQSQPQHDKSHRERDKERDHHQTQSTTTAASNKQQDMSPAPAAEEPKAAKEKMPLYKGLENFKLVEKMGDGAFSNVYKAIDLTTSKKVAGMSDSGSFMSFTSSSRIPSVKVVRKYELNATQVSLLPIYPFPPFPLDV